MSLNVYVGLAVNGFFTGLGVVAANAFFSYYVDPKIKRLHKRLRA